MAGTARRSSRLAVLGTAPALALLVIGSAAPSPDPSYEVAFSKASMGEMLSEGSEAWEAASSLSWGRRGYRTRFSAQWTSEALGLRFVASDPSPWSTMTERDDPIWNEEVVEIFLDLDSSGTHYAEYELNPHNTLCDLQMIRGIPDIEGNIEWDHRGARHRVWTVERDGETLGWDARLVLPWDGFESLPSSAGRRYPPTPGEWFRFNVFRIERPGGAASPRENVLFMPYIPTGDASFHVPRVFQRFVFVDD